MPFSPVTASKRITEKYYRYLKTTFHMGEPYKAEYERLIDRGESFASGPYLDVFLSIIVDTISQKIYKPANIYYSTYSLR